MTTGLIPLNSSLGRLIPQSPDGKKPNCTTLWRWVQKGLSDANGERIKLEVIYVGRTPHVSAEMVKAFFDKVTAARLQRMQRTQERANDVTSDELEAVGLKGPQAAIAAIQADRSRRSTDDRTRC